MKTIKFSILIFSLFCSFAVLAQNKSFQVEVTGKGHPILFFPGFTCPGEVWEDVVAELSKTNECHVFTFAGFGDVPAIEKPWLPKIKNEVEAYISDKNLKNITLVGHSLGGTLSLWLGTEDHKSISKLIVVDALPSTGALMIPNFDKDMIAYDTPYNKQLLAMSDDSFKAMANQMASEMVLNEPKKDIIKEWIIHSDRETYVYGYTDLIKLDLRDEISKIKVPVVILAADQPYGLKTVKNTYKKQYKNLESYNIKFAENSAHFIMFDQPKWLLAQIKNEVD